MNTRLLENLADWMLTHGTVNSDIERSNEYTGVRIAELTWRGREYRIIQVDGMTCQLERI